MYFILVSWRSSGPSWARAYLVFCSWRSSVVFSAQAGMSYISWQLGFLKLLFTFSLSLLLSKKLFWELLSLETPFSLGFDLVRVSHYPPAFVKSVWIVKGSILIRGSLSLEHFGFLQLSRLSSNFEVGYLTPLYELCLWILAFWYVGDCWVILRNFRSLCNFTKDGVLFI